jgi:DDE superfamily endonuclease
MLIATGLAGVWHHSRAHRCFSAAHWSADQLGLCLLEVIVGTLVGQDAPLRLVVDDSLWKRSGRKVFGATWHHDPTATGRNRMAWGNAWVVVGVLVDLPCIWHRSLCLPVLARLWWPKQTATRLELAIALVRLVAERYPGRAVHLVGDAAYAGSALRQLPEQVTVTTRRRCDAALHALAPPRQPSQRGRPRLKGKRLPELIVLAAMTSTRFTRVRVCCYREQTIRMLAAFTCLWPGVFGARKVQVVLVRKPGAPDGYDLALVATDLAASPVELVERYAARWGWRCAFGVAGAVWGGPGPQPHPARRGAHRPVRAGVHEPGHRLVGAARPAQRGCGPPSLAGAVVSAQARPRSPTCSPRCAAC